MEQLSFCIDPFWLYIRDQSDGRFKKKKKFWSCTAQIGKEMAFVSHEAALLYFILPRHVQICQQRMPREHERRESLRADHVIVHIDIANNKSKRESPLCSARGHSFMKPFDFGTAHWSIIGVHFLHWRQSIDRFHFECNRMGGLEITRLPLRISMAYKRLPSVSQRECIGYI